MTMIQRCALPLIGFSIVAGAVCAAGCSSDQTTGPDAGALTVPKNGSTYTYYRFNADTLGRPEPGSEDTATTTVVTTDATLLRKSGVHAFAIGRDTVAWMKYDGSTLYWLPWWGRNVDASWLAYPLVPGDEQVLMLRDTTFGEPAGRYTVTLKIAYLGKEQATVGSSELKVHKVRAQLETVTPYGTGSITDILTHTTWLAPELGYFAREESIRRLIYPDGDTAVTAATRVLTDYKLQ